MPAEGLSAFPASGKRASMKQEPSEAARNTAVGTPDDHVGVDVKTPSDIRALAGELSLAVVRLTRHLRGRRADAQISLTQLSALATLARDGAMTPGVLAAKERVQPPSMTRV